MINNKVRNLAPQIKAILEENEQTRNSDIELYKTYITMKLGIDPYFITLGEVMEMVANGELASIESVGRCRRKCQELYPELRATINVRHARIDEEAVYEDFAQDKRI